MKRSVQTILKEAGELLWEDIKNMKLAIVAILAYLWVNRTFFHGSCPMVMITGFPCPGCGLTRAGVALLRGDFQEAFRIHPFIYVIAFLVILFCVYRYILRRSQKVFTSLAIVVAVAMICFYIYRMATVFPGEPPMSYYRYNLIHTFLR